MANEKRLIDANALKMALCTKEGAEALGHSTVKLARVSAIVDVQPAVDAVEVVRCKDCKLRHESFYNGLKTMVLHCELNGIPVDDNDFCSYGERREGNENL